MGNYLDYTTGMNYHKVYVEDKQACMYCKRADQNAAFMTTYAYCPDYKNEKCLANYWLYVNPWMKCVNGQPTDGWQLDIDEDCKAEEVNLGQCPEEYVSYEGSSKALVKNPNLGQNKKCTISIDATQATARVTFS